MLTALIFSFFLTQQSPEEQPVTYGDIYFEESASLMLPRWHFSLGYARDLSSTFLVMDSVAGNVQYRLWKYFSTGVFGQWVHSRLTRSGNTLASLEDVDIEFDISKPQWGVFSLSSLQLMVGKWNVLNLFPLQVDLIIGGGAGLIRKETRIDERNFNQWSYIWAIEQRVGFTPNLGLLLSFFGHRSAVFIHPALALRF